MRTLAFTFAFIAALAACGAPPSAPSDGGLHPKQTGFLGGIAGGGGATSIVGGTCTNGQVATAVATDGTVTCGNITPGDYKGKVIEWSDEFLEESGLNAGIWINVPSGTGAIIANTADPSGQRVGIQTFSTGSTSTGRQGVRGGGLNGILLGAGTWVVDWVIGVEATSNTTDGYSVIVGMADTSSAVDQVDGCYFLYDERASATAPTTGAKPAAGVQELACVCAANSVRTEYAMDGSTVSDAAFTTVSAPVGAVTWPSTNVLDLEMQVNAAATEVDFFVNGTKSCVITTHIPNTAGRQTSMFANILKNVGTTARLLDLDYFHAKYTMTTARTP